MTGIKFAYLICMKIVDLFELAELAEENLAVTEAIKNASKTGMKKILQ